MQELTVSDNSRFGLWQDILNSYLNVSGINLKETINGSFLFVFIEESYDNIVLLENQTLVFFDLFNVDDFSYTTNLKKIESFPHHKKVLLTVNIHPALFLDSVQIIRFNILFNRTKSFYSDSPITRWNYYSPDSYQLNELNFDTRREKVFMSLARLHSFNNLRTSLFEFLSTYSANGFLSNVLYSNVYLRSHDPKFDPTNGCSAYSPVHNSYYDNSYLSIYIESSFRYENITHITEKTWEPLLKGHFILPFSNPGFIDVLKSMGFRFPDFIDYSYNASGLEWIRRYQMFCVEINRLLALPIHDLYVQNKDIIVHNRNQFERLHYDNGAMELLNL